MAKSPFEVEIFKELNDFKDQNKFIVEIDQMYYYTSHHVVMQEIREILPFKISIGNEVSKNVLLDFDKFNKLTQKAKNAELCLLLGNLADDFLQKEQSILENLYKREFYRFCNFSKNELEDSIKNAQKNISNKSENINKKSSAGGGGQLLAKKFYKVALDFIESEFGFKIDSSKAAPQGEIESKIDSIESNENLIKSNENLIESDLIESDKFSIESKIDSSKAAPQREIESKIDSIESSEDSIEKKFITKILENGFLLDPKSPRALAFSLYCMNFIHSAKFYPPHPQAIERRDAESSIKGEELKNCSNLIEFFALKYAHCGQYPFALRYLLENFGIKCFNLSALNTHGWAHGVLEIEILGTRYILDPTYNIFVGVSLREIISDFSCVRRFLCLFSDRYYESENYSRFWKTQMDNNAHSVNRYAFFSFLGVGLKIAPPLNTLHEDGVRIYNLADDPRAIFVQNGQVVKIK